MNNLPEKIIPAQDLQSCVICARGFTLDRIGAHEQICRRSSRVSRDSFNISQQRVKSIEAENFSKIGVKDSVFKKIHENMPSALSTNWRSKHEEFIKKIRDAKRLIEGKSSSKLNGLPIPPITEVNNHVRCPHCLKQFNQPSVERHINMCTNKLYRTPKSKTGLTGNKNQNISKTSVANK